MFFFCKHAKQIWKAAPLQSDGLNDFKNNSWLWWNGLMEAKQRAAGRAHIALTINILWQIWKSRNKMQFQKEGSCPRFTINKAVGGWIEYNEANSNGRIEEQKDGKSDRKESRWQKVGWGVVARDKKGELVEAWAGSCDRCGEPVVEEAIAIRLALLKAHQRQWSNIIIQSDCKRVVDKLIEENAEREMGVSHNLAKFAITITGEIEWRSSFPVWLVTLVKEDVGVVVPDF
ncbi:uncharacterized protein LOC113780435 [Coffea eugenioides]|uniref:uncharacterized protein LOC113780435 n=1 Tax=Coffea eugenioides TaxID=49369 RepID=UPI000F610F45|nr:uncharacterized protein LOC113780435 [Coffea eugenioides]